MKAHFLSLVFVLYGCASVHPGQKADVSNSSLPLKVSAEVIDRDEDSPFELIQVTLENTSSDWVRIDNAEVELGKDNREISVVVGQDLSDWANAKAQQEKLDAHNRGAIQLLTSTIGAAAAVTGAATNNAGVAIAGTAVMAGSSVWAAADIISSLQADANGVLKTPKHHLYGPVGIPGKMFVRRWVLLNKRPKTLLNKFVFSLKTVESQKASYVVNL